MSASPRSRLRLRERFGFLSAATHFLAGSFSKKENPDELDLPLAKQQE